MLAVSSSPEAFVSMLNFRVCFYVVVAEMDTPHARVLGAGRGRIPLTAPALILPRQRELVEKHRQAAAANAPGQSAAAHVTEQRSVADVPTSSSSAPSGSAAVSSNRCNEKRKSARHELPGGGESLRSQDQFGGVPPLSLHGAVVPVMDRDQVVDAAVHDTRVMLGIKLSSLPLDVVSNADSVDGDDFVRCLVYLLVCPPDGQVVLVGQVSRTMTSAGQPRARMFRLLFSYFVGFFLCCRRKLCAKQRLQRLPLRSR